MGRSGKAGRSGAGSRGVGGGGSSSGNYIFWLQHGGWQGVVWDRVGFDEIRACCCWSDSLEQTWPALKFYVQPMASPMCIRSCLLGTRNFTP
jgi:hypothetical protein